MPFYTLFKCGNHLRKFFFEPLKGLKTTYSSQKSNNAFLKKKNWLGKKLSFVSDSGMVMILLISLNSKILFQKQID